MADWKMKYQIEADAKKAKAEIKEVDGLLAELGLGTPLKGLAGPAAIGAAGIAAIGAAGIAAGTALFELTRQTAAYGSRISDIAERTGLGARAITAFDAAARIAGTSLESVEKSLIKFNKLIGEAATGSRSAKNDLIQLGIEPKDAIENLDGALEIIFNRIANARPGVEQATIATKAFGRAGADMIPIVNAAGGSFEKFKQEADRLGLTMSDDAVKAADKLDDQLNLLGMQAEAAGRSFSEALLPVFLDYAKSTSEWLARNKDSIRDWGQSTADVLRGLAAGWDDLTKSAHTYLGIDFSDLMPSEGTLVQGGGPLGILAMLRARGRQARLAAERDAGTTVFGKKGLTDIEEQQRLAAEQQKTAEELARRTFQAEGQILKEQQRAGKSHLELMRTEWEKHFDQRLISAEQYKQAILEIERQMRVAALAQIDIEETRALSQTKTAAERLAAEKKFANDRQQLINESFKREESAEQRIAEAAKKTAAEQIRQTERVYQQTIETHEARKSLRLAELKMELHIGAITEQQFLRLQSQEILGVLKIRKERALAAGEKHAADILDLEIRREQKEAEIDLFNIEKERQQQRIKSWKEHLKNLERELEITDEIAKKQAQMDAERAMATAQGTLLGGVASGMGVALVPIFDPENIGVMKTGAEHIKDIYADMADFAGNSIGSMIDGLTQMGTAWLVTGEFSAKAALQMAAGVALGIATQAGFKTIFEYAEAAAAAARYDFYAAGMHTAAAKLYLKTALMTGAVGVGFGLASRAVGGGSSSPASGGGSAAGQQPNMTPISRVSDHAFTSGRDEHTIAIATAIGKLEKKLGVVDRLADKIAAMRPGDVLTAASRQSPGIVAKTAVSEMRSNHAIATDLNRVTGQR